MARSHSSNCSQKLICVDQLGLSMPINMLTKRAALSGGSYPTTKRFQASSPLGFSTRRTIANALPWVTCTNML